VACHKLKLSMKLKTPVSGSRTSAGGGARSPTVFGSGVSGLPVIRSTPAEALGLTDHAWSIGELLDITTSPPLKRTAIHHWLLPSAAGPKTYRPSAPERVVKSRRRCGRVVTPCNFFVSATACSACLSRSANSTISSAARVRLFSQRSICRRACAEPLSAARRFAKRFWIRSALAFAFLTAVQAWLNSVRARPAGVWSNLRERSRLSAIVNCLYGGSSVSVVSAVIGCVPLSKATMSRRAAALFI
jgi:hypothetical protein